VARSSLTREKRARRYLQASMSAGYTGLPAEHREAYEQQMRAHERAYPGVRAHALAGASSDFDKPLSAGEREHQRALRDREGLQHADVLRMRRELRGERAPGRRPAPARSSDPRTAGPRAARAAAGAAGGAIASATGGTGGTITYLIGVMLALSLFYLLVAGKGAGVITGIVNALVGGVRAFVAPVDPIRSLEGALGASPVSTSPTPSSSASSSRSSGSAPSVGRSFGATISQLRRKDQGRDVQLAPGAAIDAPGAGEVVAVRSDPTGFGPDYPVERFTSGPYKGQELYLGHTDSALPAHARFKLGAILARTSRTGHNAPPGWAEIGFAHGGVPGPFGQPSPF
jgi:hypothetical protein